MTPSSLLFRRAAAVALVLVVASVAACGDDDAPTGDTFETPTGITCSTQEPSQTGNDTTYDAPPELTIDPDATYVANLDTSCGEIVIELDAANAPITANNFIFLARDGFFDGLTFHRGAPGFVIQGGDPDGNGSGGPGYSFQDELPDDGYPQGSVAMANSGPATNGSQFFIVTGDADFLQNNFSRFGQVTSGLDVAQGIESLGTEAPPQPLSRPVYINTVTITES